MNSVLNADLYYDKVFIYLQFHNNVSEKETDTKQKNCLDLMILFHCACNLCFSCRIRGPPLWSSGQTSWLLPDFLSSSGSGTGSTQPL
jgi:hypothetical protein